MILNLNDVVSYENDLVKYVKDLVSRFESESLIYKKFKEQIPYEEQIYITSAGNRRLPGIDSPDGSHYAPDGAVDIDLGSDNTTNQSIMVVMASYIAYMGKDYLQRVAIATHAKKHIHIDIARHKAKSVPDLLMETTQTTFRKIETLEDWVLVLRHYNCPQAVAMYLAPALMDKSNYVIEGTESSPYMIYIFVVIAIILLLVSGGKK